MIPAYWRIRTWLIRTRPTPAKPIAPIIEHKQTYTHSFVPGRIFLVEWSVNIGTLAT
jgi:hypothetical protein